jgi:hypothetical protein
VAAQWMSACVGCKREVGVGSGLWARGGGGIGSNLRTVRLLTRADLHFPSARTASTAASGAVATALLELLSRLSEREGATWVQAHCDLILQLLCDDTAEQQLADPLSAVILRDGSVHNTIPFNADPEQGREDAVDLQYGRHEPYTYYRHCTLRERNKGLFNADQNVNNNQASCSIAAIPPPPCVFTWREFQLCGPESHLERARRRLPKPDTTILFHASSALLGLPHRVATGLHYSARFVSIGSATHAEN